MFFILNNTSTVMRCASSSARASSSIVMSGFSSTRAIRKSRYRPGLPVCPADAAQSTLSPPHDASTEMPSRAPPQTDARLPGPNFPPQSPASCETGYPSKSKSPSSSSSQTCESQLGRGGNRFDSISQPDALSTSAFAAFAAKAFFKTSGSAR